MAISLGIDTSNYTTSIAAINEKGELKADFRKVLEVTKGKIGLRQSEAVFQHIKNFYGFIDDFFAKINKIEINSVGVSEKPRPIKDSYMPVFQVGLTLAQTLASSIGVPLIKTTHQEGHIMAGMWSSGKKLRNDFLVLHVSGGTTELLKVSLIRERPFVFSVKKLGGTTDLNAGQFIDRIGVKMGLNFPAGAAIEQFSEKSTSLIEVPIWVNGLFVSFSGPESFVQRLLEKGTDVCDIARSVERCITISLKKLIINACIETNITDILLVGGVVSNKFLRENLLKDNEIQHNKINLHFADASFSSDNAVGISLIAQSGVDRRD